MTYVQLSGLKDRKIAWLRPMMEQDVDLSAVSAVVDVSSADGRQQCLSNAWQRTLEYGPLNPAGSGRQPSGIKQENQQSVARCNLRNQAREKKCVCSFFEMAGEAGERLPLGKSVQFCAYLLFVGALAARLSDG